MTDRFPAWTQEVKGIGLGGRDFLGIQSVGNRIMGELMPGLTSGTRQPRYYSFFCWVLQKSREWGKCKTTREQRDFLYRLENIWLYCWKLHKHEEPPVGTPHGATAGTPSLSELVKRGASILPIGLGKADRPVKTSAFSPQLYRPSMNELGLFGPGSLWLPSDRGLQLAECFEASIRRRLALVQKLCGQDTARRDELEQLAGVLCPCNLRDCPDEEALLRKLIMGEILPPEEGDRQRRLSLLWVLDLVARSPEAEAPRQDFPDGAYYLRVSGKALSVNPNLRETNRGWAVFQHRTYIQYAITGVWYAVLKELEASSDKELRFETIAARLCDQVQKSRCVESLLPATRRHRLSELAMRTLIENLTAADSISKHGPALTELEDVVAHGVKHGLGPGKPACERHLCDLIDEEYEKGRHHAVAAYSMILLCVTIFRWSPLDAKAWRFGWGFNAGGWERLSLRCIYDDLKERLDYSVGEYLLYAIRKYVVDQHFLFATRKLLAGSNTFHFEMSDDGLRLIDSGEGQWTGANYIPASLELFQALRMVQDTGDGVYKITARGSQYLEKALKSE